MQLYISGSLALDRIMNFPGKFADHILPDKIHILNVCSGGRAERIFRRHGGQHRHNLSLLGSVIWAARADFSLRRAFARPGPS
jgi:adenosine kinase